jgi:hypothetical protein
MGFHDDESHDETIEDENFMRSSSDPAKEDDSIDDEDRKANPLRFNVQRPTVFHRRIPELK